jgi:hypothetical protein
MIRAEDGFVILRFGFLPGWRIGLTPTDASAMAAALDLCASEAEKHRAHAEHEAKSVTEAILKKAGFKPVSS